MRAVFIESHGGPEVVKYGDLPEPEPKAGEVLVKVRAGALNHLDIWVRKGIPGIEQRLPHVLGSDCAGVVAAVGAGVLRVKPGDEVVCDPGVSCGTCEFCQAGEHSECVRFGLIGEKAPGTLAEYAVVPEPNCHPRPRRLSWTESAAFPLTFVTAWRMLVTRAGLRPGEDVLIPGIGGGVALAALQIARRMGARVFVTSSSDEKLARAKALGAHLGVNYRAADVPRAILDATAKRGVDLVVDSSGGDTWAVSIECLRRGGRLVSCGSTTGPRATVDVRRIFWKQVSILGSTMGSRDDFRSMVRFIEATDVIPVIDRTYPFEQAAQALARLDAGEQFGKLVLDVG